MLNLKMMKKIFLLLSIVLVNTALGQSNISVGQEAPEINITHWVKNEPADKILDDQYTVLEFWATWCGPCIGAVPHMNELQEEFKGQDVQFVSITDESIEKVQRILKRVDFHSIVVSDTTGSTQINFGNGETGLDQYPLTVLIDKQNVIQWVGRPTELNQEVMRNFLNETETSEAEPKSFMDLINDKDLDHYFFLKESTSEIISKHQLGNIILSLKGVELKDIFQTIVAENMKVDLHTSLEEKKYDLIYKHSDAEESLQLLQKELLRQLDLTTGIEQRMDMQYETRVIDNNLLEVALDESFSAKSDAGDQLIFTAFTIKDMMKELSLLHGTSFEIELENEVKYDFIIKTNSVEQTIESLNSYGFETKLKEVEQSYLVITQD